MVRIPSFWMHPVSTLGPVVILGFFLWLVWGLPNPWFWSLVLGLVIVPQVAVFATTISLHRAGAHRSLRLHPVMDIVFRVILWLTTSFKRGAWIAAHRKHHRFTDVEGDPHSPIRLGRLKVQLLNFYYYARAVRDPNLVTEYAPDIIPDRLDRNLLEHRYGNYAGLIGGTGFLMLLLGPLPGFTAAALHAVMYVFGISSSINSLCHWLGYRNFDNTATNIRLLAWLTGGEALHNNHHEYEGSPRFSVRPDKGEVDLAWYAILILKAIGAITFVGTTIQERELRRA